MFVKKWYDGLDKYDKELARLVSTVAAITLLIFFLLWLCIFSYSTVAEIAQCQSLQSLDGEHNYRWTLFTGCVVETGNGYWVDAYYSPALLEHEFSVE